MHLASFVRASALAILVFSAMLASAPTTAQAQACGNTGAGFDAWMAAYKSRAAAQGITIGTIATALNGVSYDPGVIRLDRGQRSFKLSFEQFYARRVSSSLISRGQRLMATHKATLDRIQRQFGVPGAVLISIWGLETNYATSSGGTKSIFRSLATLAFDCRRSKFFENELTNALRIVQRGDMPASAMVGGWAGEIGPMQFLPSSYVKYAVDFDGNGRRDLVRSVPDMLASTANYLMAYGWKAGQAWAPGSPNYPVIQQWNKADVYGRTIAVMSSRMAGR